MEHRERQGCHPEDGGFRPGIRDSNDDPSDVPGDSGGLWRPCSFGFQERRPVGQPDLEAILRAVPSSRQEFSQGLFDKGLAMHIQYRVNTCLSLCSKYKELEICHILLHLKSKKALKLFLNW